MEEPQNAGGINRQIWRAVNTVPGANGIPKIWSMRTPEARRLMLLWAKERGLDAQARR
jgi:hypothetical protein